MTNIILTEEHKSKLLEMCKKLFPEYKDIYWNSGKGSNGSSEHLGFGTQNKQKNCIDYNYIHWFEFCMTHLVEKILNPFPQKPQRNISDKFKEFFWQTNIYWDTKLSDHPIDLLYKEFKTKKNEKN